MDCRHQAFLILRERTGTGQWLDSEPAGLAIVTLRIRSAFPRSFFGRWPGRCCLNTARKAENAVRGRSGVATSASRGITRRIDLSELVGREVVPLGSVLFHEEHRAALAPGFIGEKQGDDGAV